MFVAIILCNGNDLKPHVSRNSKKNTTETQTVLCAIERTIKNNTDLE